MKEIYEERQGVLETLFLRGVRVFVRVGMGARSSYNKSQINR